MRVDREERDSAQTSDREGVCGTRDRRGEGEGGRGEEREREIG